MSRVRLGFYFSASMALGVLGLVGGVPADTARRRFIGAEREKESLIELAPLARTRTMTRTKDPRLRATKSLAACNILASIFLESILPTRLRRCTVSCKQASENLLETFHRCQ